MKNLMYGSWTFAAKCTVLGVCNRIIFDVQILVCM